MQRFLKISFFLFVLCVFTINVSAIPKILPENFYVLSGSNHNYSQELRLALNNGQIILTADLDANTFSYRNFKVKIGNEIKAYDWRSIGNPSYMPEMRLMDLGENKNAGLVITLVESEGTGLYIQRVHVLRIRDFKEIPVEDPLRIIQKHVRTHAENDGIIIDIDGNKTLLDKNYLYKQGINNTAVQLTYDNHIVYRVRDGSLAAEIGLSDDNLVYIADFNIDYVYKDEELVMRKIRITKY